ncbi:hypothetical protein KX927_05390 [Escherichia coli]|uniref:hypothetical protein n=1 Tax=Escherichia coli TaxID=562 RepID=UPI001931BF91|nr:hypothetical protein [Escherichia coli]MBL7388966.1 hypothetical protein [Escherichia coli]UWH33450.1 hypothetical protein KYX58_04755 [Escherichia coli]UWH38113.1 hypothetical protein KX927_05390 [Escherichia coli]
MNVKRYEWVSCDEHACHCDVVESAEGDMVDYEDYAALEARCASLAAENAELKDEISNITFMRDDDFFGSTQRAQEVMGRLVNVKTPETDAFLAEVRAQGVDSAINTVIAMMNHQHPVTSKAIDILRVHAYQLRKGVQP